MFGEDVNVAELSRQLGVKRATLYKAWEREEERLARGRKHGHNIDIKTAIALRKLSGRSLSWILTGEEDAPPKAAQELATARNVAASLVRQAGLSAAEARAVVGRLALDESVQWENESALYHRALDAAGFISVTTSPTVEPPTTPPKALTTEKVGRVRKKVPARRKP